MIIKCKKIKFQDKLIRVAIESDGNLWVCMYDCCIAIKRPTLMTTCSIRSECPTAQKLIFDKDWTPNGLWAIRPYDIKMLVAFVQNDNKQIYKLCQQLIEWSSHILDNPNNKSNYSNMNNKNDIQIFRNENFGDVRIIANQNNVPLFCLTDVCKALELRADNTLQRLSKDGYYRLGVIDSLGRTQQAYFINEKNLYRVIMRSDKKEAEQFQDWVYGEVLPSIRKHGAYMTDDTIEKALTDPDFLIQLATNLKEEKQKRLEAENKAALLQEDNSYKSEVIEGLTSEISLADMRQRINQIMRKAGVDNAHKNWHTLYYEFDRKYHINVMSRINNSMYQGTRLDYIEKELNALPELYELTCKLFESSYEQIVNDWAKTARHSRLH